MKLTNPARRKWILILAAGGLVLAACSACSAPVTTPTVTVPPAASETPTATIVWFPATGTPTTFPTQAAEPTQDERPGMGDLIFSDGFGDPALWDTAGSADASAMVTRNQLVLSITGPGPISLASLRSQPALDDFYAEASVDVSLCSDKDQYGMVFRAVDIRDLYRFTIDCSGQERLERVRGGVIYALLDWLSSNDASVGAPVQVKLGVWAVGREIRFFLNEAYQFSLDDPVFSAGRIGFFIYANGKSPVTVSFSDLRVYAVNYTLPTITPFPSWTPNPGATATHEK